VDEEEPPSSPEEAAAWLRTRLGLVVVIGPGVARLVPLAQLGSGARTIDDPAVPALAGLGLAALIAAMMAGRTVIDILSKLGLDAGDPEVRAKLDVFRRGQRQKQVKASIAGAPSPPPLKPEDEEKLRRLASELGVDPKRLEELARDPARGWRYDEATLEEARVAIRLERGGQVRDVVRDPRPEGDFIEDNGAGQRWDVKSYRPNDSPQEIAADIEQELAGGDTNVIVNEAHMTLEQIAQVRDLVAHQGWTDRVIYATS
jgi:hypothetical protein